MKQLSSSYPPSPTSIHPPRPVLSDNVTSTSSTTQLSIPNDQSFIRSTTLHRSLSRVLVVPSVAKAEEVIQ